MEIPDFIVDIAVGIVLILMAAIVELLRRIENRMGDFMVHMAKIDAIISTCKKCPKTNLADLNGD